MTVAAAPPVSASTEAVVGEWAAVGWDQYRHTLGDYAPRLLTATAERVARHAEDPLGGPPAERLPRLLSDPEVVAALVNELAEPERRALALWRSLPYLPLRWDHAVRLTAACGIPSAYRVLQRLLADGLLTLRRHRDADDQPLPRFEIADGTDPSRLPSVTVAAALLEVPLDLPAPLEALPPPEGMAKAFRTGDGWEIPIRLAQFWKLVWSQPVKRTQQGNLFKRDSDRLAADGVLHGDMLDAQAELADPGMFAFAVARQLHWLEGPPDALKPKGVLPELFPGPLPLLALHVGRAVLQVEEWNELGDQIPYESFATEVPSSRAMVLILLAALGEDASTGIDELGDRLAACHPPFNAGGSVVGEFKHANRRIELARLWVRGFLLGPMFQLGLVATDGSGHVRLAPLGRVMMGLPTDLPEAIDYPQALIAQPNHEMIVYRQALGVDLLADLVRFADLKSTGAALLFELTDVSIYRGLETGCTSEGILELLGARSSVPVPDGVASSVRNWSRQRERIVLYPDGDLFEFDSPEDLQAAVERGLDGVPVTPKLLLVPSDREANRKLLRIVASRDYHREPEPCVDTGPDGVTLKVDVARSDLMLETQIVRLADPVGMKDSDGRVLYRITPATLTRALRGGMAAADVTDWFALRTGSPPPPAVALLLRTCGGAPPKVRTRELVVIQVEDATLLDGLLQHPQTQDLIGERLGPTVAVIADADLPRLRDAAGGLNLSFGP